MVQSTPNNTIVSLGIGHDIGAEEKLLEVGFSQRFGPQRFLRRIFYPSINSHKQGIGEWAVFESQWSFTLIEVFRQWEKKISNSMEPIQLRK